MGHPSQSIIALRVALAFVGPTAIIRYVAIAAFVVQDIAAA